MKKVIPILITIIVSLGLVLPGQFVFGQIGSASLYLSPAQGTVTVGSVFNVSVFLNTGGENVNAIDVVLEFDQDKLQIASPTTGQSVVSVWVAQPSYSNLEGRARFQGGVPDPGINTSAGLVSTISFRARATGRARISVSPRSRVFRNDGQGTDILVSRSGASFDIILPPPAGPEVNSPSHPDQAVWSRNNDPVFTWDRAPEMLDFSFGLNNDPLFIPDDVGEGLDVRANFNDVNDGIWYFHVKALGPGGWGGVSHYVVLIDSTPPAKFTVKTEPGIVTKNQQPIFSFLSTDEISGLDHYEVKILNTDNASKPEFTPFFVEVTSPFQTPALEPGHYDVIVRAFDFAGNFQDSRVSLRILEPGAGIFSDEGIYLAGLFMPWWLAFIIFDGLLVLLGLFIWFLHRRHEKAHEELERETRRLGAEWGDKVGWLREKLKERKKPDIHSLGHLPPKNT
jgi:hypothetical protein